MTETEKVLKPVLHGLSLPITPLQMTAVIGQIIALSQRVDFLEDKCRRLEVETVEAKSWMRNSR